MKELYVRVSPTVFNYAGAIVEDGYLVKELTGVPTDLINLQDYACELDCGGIVLCGNPRYTEGLKKLIDASVPSKYNRKLKIRTEEVKG